MLTPAYKLTLGHKVVDTTDEPRASTVVDLTVTLDLDTPADGFSLVLGNVGGFRPARDDEAVIELGYADDSGGLTRVMTGKVAVVEPNLTTTRIAGTSGAAPLLRTFVEQTYEGKTAGAIVRDLAGRAGAPVAAVEDGIRFPAYVVDGRRSAFHHMLDLAGLCGCDLYCDAAGKLVFERFVAGKTVHVYEYAKHIVELDALRAPARAGRVEAWGESPTDRKGDESWGWLTTDFSGSRGEAGQGSLLLLERPVLRTRAAARTAAQAALTALQRWTLRGRLVGTGRPAVKLGDAVRLSGVPGDDALNASYQVRSVIHRITKAGGFTTTLGIRAIAT